MSEVDKETERLMDELLMRGQTAAPAGVAQRRWGWGLQGFNEGNIRRRMCPWTSRGVLKERVRDTYDCFRRGLHEDSK